MDFGEEFRSPERPTFANSGKSRQKRQKEPPVPSLPGALYNTQNCECVPRVCVRFSSSFRYRIVSAPASLPLMPTPNNASGSTVAPHERQRRKTKVNSSYAAMTAVLRDRAAKGNKFTTQNSVQEVLKPEVSSCPFGYFWDSSQKYLSLRRAKYFNSLLTLKSDFTTLICTKSRRIEEYHAKGNFHQRRTGE